MEQTVLRVDPGTIDHDIGIGIRSHPIDAWPEQYLRTLPSWKHEFHRDAAPLLTIAGAALATPSPRPHISPMPTLIILMIATAIVVSIWNANRAAAERAEAVGRDACRAAGVQWLDQSVHAIAWRLYRQESGWLGMERTFRFDYSIQGDDRHVGRMVLRGDRLVSFSGPVTATPIPFQSPND